MAESSIVGDTRISRASLKFLDAERFEQRKKVSVVLFFPTYGSSVRQLPLNYALTKDVNKKLEHTGYKTAVGLVNEFLAKL